MYRRWEAGAKFLPHARGAAASLEAIRRDGVDRWLATQKERWSCPDCGAPFTWYARECHECGRGLTAEAYEISGWRRLLCRLMLFAAYRKGKAARATGVST
jgi:hypothetical protein